MSAIERFTQSYLPGYQQSRASSTDRSTVATSLIDASTERSPSHEADERNGGTSADQRGATRPTLNGVDSDVVSTRLEQMRKQVLSKEFWMADEICKECFHCGAAFTAFRRKHHCRTCGCIFDSKCTSIISGERFGVQGSLRVCKTCLDIINRRHDSSESDESGNDSVLHHSFMQPPQVNVSAADSDSAVRQGPEEGYTGRSFEESSAGPITTPMMAIPATRRLGHSTNRKSVLEFDGPQSSRPNSARSLKAVPPNRPPSSSHKVHQSRSNFLDRFRSTTEGNPPFHRNSAADELKRRSKLPALHDDNIIDPDLAPYMSDDESSGDEQMSIFTALNGTGAISTNHDNEKPTVGSLPASGKKHRPRTSDKTISGARGAEDNKASSLHHTRSNRRRNKSISSGNAHFVRETPRHTRTATPLNGFEDLSEETAVSVDTPLEPSSKATSRMTRSASMKDAKAPAIELNNASLRHVRRLLRQLLQDARIPNVGSWEKALIPILLQCTDDVNPDIREGDDIDIRHYVKLKKIPGGKPGDTSYVSGVVFTKKLALKSMARNISHPRIVIISFPIEYQRHQQHYMSLEPVIAQEKDFLRNMVNRIASLRPHVVLVQNHVSGLALKYLSEANITVVYNVKQSVVEAVSRFAQTEIISSIDMVALKPVLVGKSAGFDVKTYVHRDFPGKKKTCIYISGCPKDLGCTIVLRGASMSVLSKMKKITEFMVYVVYNLKLETCLMRDEFLLIPSIADEDDKAASDSKGSSHLPDTPTLGSSVNTAAMNEAINATNTLSTGNETSLDPNVDPQPTTLQKSPSERDTETGEVNIPSSTNDSYSQAQPTASNYNSQDGSMPENIPMPTFYSDVVTKHQTKILSASPFVKFTQPYLLMNAREQERRLVYLKRLRDQDSFEEQADVERVRPQQFQLIQPEMVHGTVKGAPKQIMEVLHAVHDAEYDKALHNYQTQKRQWENYIQGNLNLFDPYGHQNIVVLYTVVCTDTTVPCAGPELTAMSFYNEHEISHDFFPDCTLGQYVEDLCLTADAVCVSNGCERKMTEHHRTYVHGEARITVFVEKSPCKLNGLQDSILMWSYCKICKKETQVMPMSESTWKYSFGKYLELSFWSTGLKLRAGFCPHDLHRDHLRYFGYRNATIRIHYDSIDLLEVVVPRTRITWKVDNDLRLKNELFIKTEERWNRFMASVKARIKGINTDSVVGERLEACRAEVETLSQRAQDEHASLLRKLQDKYMESKYYETIPMNRAIRAMQEKVAEWDTAFADFDGNYFPSEKDIRRLAALQLKNLFLDREAPISNEAAEPVSDIEEKPLYEIKEDQHDTIELPEARTNYESAIETGVLPEPGIEVEERQADEVVAESNKNSMSHLDLATPWPAANESNPDRKDFTAEGGSQIANTHRDVDAIEPNGTMIAMSESPTPNISLSEKIQQLRRANLKDSADETSTAAAPSGIPRPSDRGAIRRAGLAISPPMARTQSQPAIMSRHANSPNMKLPTVNAREKEGTSSSSNDEVTPAIPLSEPVKEKKLSDRLGLASLKGSRKSGQSLIPRSIHAKGKESKVSTLAKHFEQLSWEFEKERLRDKKQRAAKVTQSRAFPKASSKPIVEVYKDVNEAVEERGPSYDDLQASGQSSQGPIDSIDGAVSSDNIERAPGSLESTMEVDREIAEMSATRGQADSKHDLDQAASGDEASNVERQSSEEIADVEEIDRSSREANEEDEEEEELPKHEKTSLLKMLTNFWAERSASGWTQLEYPFHASDHVFVDSDVIVREDEPSSLIAFALSSQDYIEKLDGIRQQGHASQPKEGLGQESADSTEADVETSLLRATGTHLKYQFAEGSAKMLCKIFYAEQFDAVRRKCGVADRIVESLSRCLKWDSKGGKTKSVFLKTLDERFVLKSLSPIETQAFLGFAPAYFSIMAEALFHELPTVIAKMLGFYQIVIKNPSSGTEIKWDVLVMENLFYDRSPTRIFDLKGSMRNRKIQSTGEQNEVLLDENMVEFIYESPLFAREHAKKLLKASVWNDTLFLARQNVMDYSLMVAVDEARKELVVGIIDCIRTYTWDKKLESWIKDRGRNRPTVTSPKEYKSRFREAMDRYVLQAPNCWHHFSPYDTRLSKLL